MGLSSVDGGGRTQRFCESSGRNASGTWIEPHVASELDDLNVCSAGLVTHLFVQCRRSMSTRVCDTRLQPHIGGLPQIHEPAMVLACLTSERVGSSAG